MTLPPLSSDIAVSGAPVAFLDSSAAVLAQRMATSLLFIEASTAFHACTLVELTLKGPRIIWYSAAVL